MLILKVIAQSSHYGQTYLGCQIFPQCFTGRHVPGSKTPFSFIPNPDQNKVDTLFISVVAYGVYIPLLRPIQFRLQTNKNFEKMPKNLQILMNPGSKIRVGFCRSSWGSNHFIKEIPCHITHYRMENQAQYSEAPQIIMFCNN